VIFEPSVSPLGPEQICLQRLCSSGRRKRYLEKRLHRKWDRKHLVEAAG
jgi:hypothetical protein